MLWLALQALPIDTSREDIKESLKKSQLGSRIMFLAKCPDETPGNKKTAVELVQNWSRWGQMWRTTHQHPVHRWARNPAAYMVEQTLGK
jgi:hypothetical protein